MTIALWMGFLTQLQLRREGIGRYGLFLMKSILENDSMVSIELWTYSFNEEEIRFLFNPLLQKYPSRISVHTERNPTGHYSNDFVLFFSFLAEGISNLGDIGGSWRILSERCRKESKSHVGKIFLSRILAFTLFLLHRIENIYIMGLKFLKRHRYLVLGSMLLSFAVSTGLLGLKGPFSKNFEVFTTTHLGIMSLFFVLIFFLWGIKRSFGLMHSNLADMANRKSNASAFIVLIFTAGEGYRLNKPTLTIIHDLIPIEFDTLFKDDSTDITAFIHQIDETIGHYVRKTNNRFVFLNRDCRDRIFLHHYGTDALGESVVIYTPVLAPEREFRIIPPTSNIDHSRYIFYPTQIRPHKNVPALIRIFERLIEETDLSLILTAQYSENKACVNAIKKSHTRKHIFEKVDLSETQLREYYENADLVVVPTLAEGNFPLQVMEAMSLDVPVAFSRIPVVEERLKMCPNYESISKSLVMFNPYDDDDILEKTRYALANRTEVIKHQREALKEIMHYELGNWAKEYMRLMPFAEQEQQK